MKFIRTSELVKLSGNVFDSLSTPLRDFFWKEISLKDNRLKEAVKEERYEEAAQIRDEYEEKAAYLADRLASDIEEEIDQLGVPYRFENISATGLAVNGYCVINKDVLKSHPAVMMFVIFHELAHHYQYGKHGKDFAESIYTNDISKIDSDVEKLVWIENVADKMAQNKTNYYIKKYDLGYPLITGKGKSDKGELKSHVLRMKQMVLNMPPEKRNIHDINEALYNFIKVSE